MTASTLFPVAFDGLVRVHDIVSLGVVLELQTTGWVMFVDATKKEGVESTFLSFSGCSSGTVLAWEVRLDPMDGASASNSVVVGDCGSSVYSLAVSNGGDIVVAGCGSGTVFIWKRLSGDAAPVYELVTSFSCAGAERLSLSAAADEQFYEDHLRVAALVVSRDGSLVVAGGVQGDLAFWSSTGSGTEGTVHRCQSSNESGAEVVSVLLSDDGSSLFVVFDQPSGCEIWDVALRIKRSPRVELSNFVKVYDAVLVSDKASCGEESERRDALVVAGDPGDDGDVIIIYSTNDNFKPLNGYPLFQTAQKICCSSFGGDKRILVSSDDCIRMLDADWSPVHDVSESSEEDPINGSLPLETSHTNSWSAAVLEESSGDGPLSPDARIDFLYSSELPVPRPMAPVCSVAAIPTAGLIVAGHYDGQLSLWRAESGEFVRALGDGRGSLVVCVDVSADNGQTVSGHSNGIAFVWGFPMSDCRFVTEECSEPAREASTWKFRFALEGHSKEVVCATISMDGSRIVTFDGGGELRLWHAECGGAALKLIAIGVVRDFASYASSRGAISHDGKVFLWAVHDDGYVNWKGSLIDLGSGRVVFGSESSHSDWDEFMEAMSSHMHKYLACKGEEVACWRAGSLRQIQYVELRSVVAPGQLADVWFISQGGERGQITSHVQCGLRSSIRATASAKTVEHSAPGCPPEPTEVLVVGSAVVKFYCTVGMITADWIPDGSEGHRRAVVACELSGRSRPAILHFYPAS